MARPNRFLKPTIWVLSLAIILMSGCAPTTVETPPEAAAPESVESPDPQTPDTAAGAAESFLAWLEASRVPDVEAACTPLAPELVTRMLEEMQSDGFAAVTTCEEMVVVSAELYRAFDQSAEVDIAVQTETETDAVLFVTYLDSGDCGTVVMTRPVSEWIITEQTEECAA